MLPKLDPVEYLHASCGLIKRHDVTHTVSAVSMPPKPVWHERSVNKNQVGRYRSNTIVNNWKGPLYYRIAPLCTDLLVRISYVANIIFLTSRVEQIVRQSFCQYIENRERDSNHAKVTQAAFPDRSEILNCLVLVDLLEKYRWPNCNQQEDYSPNTLKLLLLLV